MVAHSTEVIELEPLWPFVVGVLGSHLAHVTSSQEIRREIRFILKHLVANECNCSEIDSFVETIASFDSF